MTISCSVCHRQDDNPMVQGMQPSMPTGWGILTLEVRGEPIVNRRVCSGCIGALRSTLTFRSA